MLAHKARHHLCCTLLNGIAAAPRDGLVRVAHEHHVRVLNLLKVVALLLQKHHQRIILGVDLQESFVTGAVAASCHDGAALAPGNGVLQPQVAANGYERHLFRHLRQVECCISRLGLPLRVSRQGARHCSAAAQATQLKHMLLRIAVAGVVDRHALHKRFLVFPHVQHHVH